MGRDHRGHEAGHRLLPSAPRRTTTTEAIGQARTCMAARSSRSTRGPGSGGGTSRWSTDLWDFDGNAAPQLTTIKRNGKSIDVVAVAGKTGFLYVFDRVTGRQSGRSRNVPKATCPVNSRGRRSRSRRRRRPSASSVHARRHQSSPCRQRRGPREVQAAPRRSRNQGLFTPIHFDDTLHIPGSNGGALFGYTAAEPTSGAVYVISQDNPAILHLVKNPQPGGPPGAAAHQRECAVCHGPDRGGTQNGPSLLDVPGRLDPATVRGTIVNGKGRMPAFPHITDVEMETLVSYIVAPPRAVRGRGRGGPSRVPDRAGGRLRRSAGARRSGWRPRPRWWPRPYPEGVEQTPQYVINAYGTIGLMMKPPFTKLSRYDLNTGTIKWQVGLGDDARLAAHGITGTGVTQMRSSLIVTSAGLIFAPGGDSKLRAADTETGKLLWTSPALGGTIRGGHSMHQIGGHQYVLVAVSGDTPPAGQWLKRVTPPSGFIAFARSRRVSSGEARRSCRARHRREPRHRSRHRTCARRSRCRRGRELPDALGDANAVAERIGALGRRPVAIAADVSIAAEVERLVGEVRAALGPIDILVNNAGIARRQQLDEITEADWDEIVDGNLKSCFLVTQAGCPTCAAAVSDGSST